MGAEIAATLGESAFNNSAEVRFSLKLTKMFRQSLFSRYTI